MPRRIASGATNNAVSSARSPSNVDAVEPDDDVGLDADPDGHAFEVGRTERELRTARRHELVVVTP